MTMQDNNLPLPRRSFMQSLALASAGLYLGSTSVFGQDQRLATPGATVATSYGQVRGLLRDGIQQFWGLAYGASTAGENRFMPPRPPASWTAR